MELDISGAKVFYTLPFDFPVLGKLQISETMIVSWIVMLLITGLCIWLTRDLKVENISRRQAVAELLVEKSKRLCDRQYGRKIPLFHSVCCGTVCNQCGIESDQPGWTPKSDSGSVYGSRLGNRGVYHDYQPEDQGRRCRWISERLHSADSGSDAVQYSV